MIALMSYVSPKYLANKVISQDFHYLNFTISISWVLKHSLDSNYFSIAS